MKIGHLIRPLRAGDSALALHRAPGPHTIELSSDAFGGGLDIPARFTADGDGVAPGLHWAGVPAGTVELVLVVQDPDAPLPRPIVHAVVTGIDPNTTSLPQAAWSHVGAHGPNSFGKRGWLPPAPVPGHGTHHYVFQLFALDRRTGSPRPPGLRKLIEAMNGHVLACGVLVGHYERS